MSLIREELLNKDFYQKSISLFLKSTPGIPERLNMWTDILLNVNECGDNFFDYLNIFYYESPEQNYLKSHPGENNRWLDGIAQVLGLQRQVIMTRFIVDGNAVNEPVTEEVTLTDTELLIYIEATLCKYIFDGTREGIREAYEGTSLLNWNIYDNSTALAGDPDIKNYLKHVIRKSELGNLRITYADGTDAASCTICLQNTANVSNNTQNLFLNGFLTIESMGINYLKVLSDDFRTGKWNSAEYYKINKPPYYVFA